jgi:Pyruvate/2-oxoacid:ferredoxin oxidoreductase gamma subunit
MESSQPIGYHDQEIAGDDGLGVIANKHPPVLRRGPPLTSSIRFGRPIGAHCAWRNIDTQLHRKLSIT